MTFIFSKNNFFLQHIMLENPGLEEENIIKGIRNLFTLEKVKKRNHWYHDKRYKKSF